MSVYFSSVQIKIQPIKNQILELTSKSSKKQFHCSNFKIYIIIIKKNFILSQYLKKNIVACDRVLRPWQVQFSSNEASLEELLVSKYNI